MYIELALMYDGVFVGIYDSNDIEWFLQKQMK